MQPVDYTTFYAACTEIRADWLPARLEQVYQRDRYTISLGMRTLNQRGWIDISWHPQAARICQGDPPPRIPDTFTFSQQLKHQLSGLALVAISEIEPWERAIDFQFAKRPGEEALWHLYIEIMGKYSNVILTTGDRQIVTCAHQVSNQQSRVRPLQTGQFYEFPPSLNDPIPNLMESQERWQARVSLIPGLLKLNLLKNYRGLSSALVLSMIQSAGLDVDITTENLTTIEWQKLFTQWQLWLTSLGDAKFQGILTGERYTVVPWQANFNQNCQKFDSVQELLNSYYSSRLNQQEFSQLKHQITQKISNVKSKQNNKANEFRSKLQQSDDADKWRAHADLLMANLHIMPSGIKEISLPDFETNEPIKISLEPEKNPVQNAQNLYKRHQKLKRARQAVEPLLNQVETEINYLEQVEASLYPLENYANFSDLETLQEIRDELIEQGYLTDNNYNRSSQNRPNKLENLNCYRYFSPSGFQILIGRNNIQNDLLTFRIANDYDLWFHTQEIPGSHSLLRLTPGAVPDQSDLQFTADLTAYYSRARQSEQAPVVYTELKHVYKPKGAKPGMVVYKHETVIWGKPLTINHSLIEQKKDS